MNYKKALKKDTDDFSASSLLFISLVIATSDLVVFQLVRVLGLGNNTQVITQLLLLEVSLGEVLQLTLGESKVLGAGNGDLGGVTGDNNATLSEVSSLSISDLDAFIEVLLEGSDVKNLIVNRSCAVNDELDGALLCLSLCLK